MHKAAIDIKGTPVVTLQGFCEPLKFGVVGELLLGKNKRDGLPSKRTGIFVFDFLAAC